MIDRLLSYVAPHSCCGCGEIGTVLCEYCKDDIVQDPFEQCIGCFKPVSGLNLCSVCTDFGTRTAWCVGAREGTLKRLVDNYKFDGVLAGCEPIVTILDHTIPLLPDDTVVTGVPTASAHIRVRGYDHLEKITKSFAKRRQLSYKPLLTRQSASTQHFMKSRKERLLAAQNAFALKPVSLPKRVLLIDDIVTTGATLKVTAGLLMDAGVEELMIGVVARQPQK